MHLVTSKPSMPCVVFFVCLLDFFFVVVLGFSLFGFVPTYLSRPLNSQSYVISPGWTPQFSFSGFGFDSQHESIF